MKGHIFHLIHFRLSKINGPYILPLVEKVSQYISIVQGTPSKVRQAILCLNKYVLNRQQPILALFAYCLAILRTAYVSLDYIEP